MTLDEKLAAERAECPDTYSEAWRHRCEVFHYARMDPGSRRASFNQMLAKGRDSDQVRRIEDEATALCRELGFARASTSAPPSPLQAPSRTSTHGAPWTPQLDRALVDLAKAGRQVTDLASHFGRSTRAIELRLERLNGAEPAAA